jgi:DNA sulfur modification protein DndB
MGRWTYYVVQMAMQDLNRIQFAHHMKEFGGALSEAIQREVNVSRVKSEIVQYLLHQQDRFFNSIVIAGFGGEPQWYPVELVDDPRFEMIADEAMVRTFGILKMTDETRYYALDGQHRLLAIKTIMDPADHFFAKRPNGFEDEKLSVVLVVPNEADDVREFRKHFRRLFGHLNRYAKPMDQATSIIMDEDDAFAISLRRLFAEHEFFQVVGKDRDSSRILTRKGRNIPPGSTHLTTIEVLYEMCEEMLSSALRLNEWTKEGLDADLFKRFRPSDETLDAMYSELSNIWTVLIELIPDLRVDGTKMRNNDVTDVEGVVEKNCLLFRPVGQVPLAKIVRYLLDRDPVEAKTSDPEVIRRALSPLTAIHWDLAAAPWRNLVWVNALGKDGETTWRITEKPLKKIQSFLVSLLAIAVLSKDDRDFSPLKNTYLDLVTEPANDPDFDAEESWKAAVEALSI